MLKNKILAYVLIGMLFLELAMIACWILAYMEMSPFPANVVPMQIVSLITGTIGHAVLLIIHLKKIHDK